MAYYFDENTNVSSDLLFVRNGDNNIAKSWIKETSSSKTAETSYTYDNHPNPFFKLGSAEKHLSGH
jgi:hypothetical protein